MGVSTVDPDGREIELYRRLEQYLHETLIAGPAPRVVPLTGDASDRRYFRAMRADGSSVVLALYAEPIAFETLPFARMATLFEQMPVPVPKILGHSDALGIVAMQDLGDVTLQAHVGAASPEEHASLYRSATDIIHHLQTRGDQLRDPRYPSYGLAFDEEKLTWELRFFVRHFLEAYRGATLGDAERDALDQEWAAVARELAAERRVLCHRDYHSRNLMVHDDQLYVIDFQDARLGPDTYDLVSLLRDSYVDIGEPMVDELIAWFLSRDGTRAASAGAFRRRFDLMSVQRNLKALGTFGYQTTARRNPTYIQYMPRTLHAVRANLSRYPRFEVLRRLLAAHLDELA